MYYTDIYNDYQISNSDVVSLFSCDMSDTQDTQCTLIW